ncbi:MAG: glycosyltransferase family 2 protein [Bacteroides thetaiotaomicron]|nr:glycosyltransferase family 2 protein [Bacteroides thetaiotaomicron]
MEDITVIILTKNEEKNVAECIHSAWQIAKRVIVVDSGSTDQTVSIAQKNNAETFFHEWPGHAKQFNWALDNCDIQTQWVFRLDADERISDVLAEEIKQRLADSDEINGFSMRWRVYFMKRWIKHGGTYKHYFTRLFRYQTGRVEEKLMDEHIIVNGKTEKLSGYLIHYDYKGLDEWLVKHIGYSNLEVAMYREQNRYEGGNVVQKKKRGFYYNLPSFMRAKLYFWYRYYIQLGFLDGKEGKIFCFLQAYWYRYLVDAKIYERERVGGGNP